MARQKKAATQDEDLTSFTLPSDEKSRKEIRDILYEMSGIQQIIKDRKDDLKGYVDTLKEKYDIPKKIIPKVAKIVYNHDYDKVSAENQAVELLYEGIMQTRDTSAKDEIQSDDE